MAENDLKFRALLEDLFTPTANKVQGSLGGLAKSAGIAMAGFLSMEKAVSFAQASIEEFKNSEMTVARLGATVKAAGERTAYTAQSLQKMATAMQGKTIFGDEAIMDAQRMMLTMQNMTDDILPQAIQASMDMAGTEEELASKAFALGKALESPAEGFLALKRAGIILSDQTEKQIKNLIEEGKLHEAQVLILKEVEKRYGGVAKAMGETATGMQIIKQNAVGDKMEELGKKLIPVQTALIGISAGAIDAYNAFDNLWQKASEGVNRKAMESNGYFAEYEDMTLQQLLTTSKAVREHRGKNEKDVEESGKRLIQLQRQIDNEQTRLAQEFNNKQTMSENQKAKEQQDIADAKKLKDKEAQDEAIKVQEALSKIVADKNKARSDANFAEMKDRIAKQEEVDKQSLAIDEKNAEMDTQLLIDKVAREKEASDAIKKIKEDEDKFEEVLYNSKRNMMLSLANTMNDTIVKGMKLSKENAKQTKADAIGMAIMQNAMAQAGAAASIWSTMGGSWQEKLAESIAISATLFASLGVEIATINKQKFATGGIVQGASSGDRMNVGVNGGEMILTQSMQSNLLQMARGQGGGGGASIVISPTVKVDSGMTAGERDRMITATARSVRDSLIHLRNTNQLPAGLAFA